MIVVSPPASDLGTFILTHSFAAIGDTPASGHVLVEGIPSNTVRDPAGAQLQLGPREVRLSAGSFMVTLPTDSAAGNSAAIRYRVTTDLDGLANIEPVEFYAPQAGAFVTLAGIRIGYHVSVDTDGAWYLDATGSGTVRLDAADRAPYVSTDPTSTDPAVLVSVDLNGPSYT